MDTGNLCLFLCPFQGNRRHFADYADSPVKPAQAQASDTKNLSVKAQEYLLSPRGSV